MVAINNESFCYCMETNFHLKSLHRSMGIEIETEP